MSHWAQDARRYLAQGVIAGVVQALAMVVQLGLMAWFVDRLIVHDQPVALVATGGALALAVLVRSIGQWAQEMAGLRASHRVRRQVRRALLNAWAGAGPVGLSGCDSGRLSSEWTEQVDALDGYYARFLPQMILAVIVPLIILTVVAAQDWLAALFLLAAAPLIPLFMALIGMGAERVNQRHYESLARLSGHFLDRIRGMTTLQLFGRSADAVADVAAATDHYRRLNMATLRVAFLSSAVLEFFASVAIAAVAIYVGFALLGMISFGPADDMSLFSGLFVLLLAPEFFQPLRLLSQYYHDRAAALGAAAHLSARLVVSDSLVPQAAQEQHREPDSTGIRVSGLGVRYPSGREVLGDLDFELPSGQTLIVTGPSGCGKSTLLAVLAGFMAPSQGDARIRGQSPGSMPVGWMGQKPWLVPGSWRQNLRLTAPEASEAAMLEAIARVGLRSVLDGLPEGLSTRIGEGGLGLSGGQARRLALARLFLTSSTVMLLDEPTAGLDEATEAEVIEGVRGIIGGQRLCVIASHQPALRALGDQHLALGSTHHA
nr:thiol reductant ABC exporter subunit CydD [Halomonas utahensis]